MPSPSLVPRRSSRTGPIRRAYVFPALGHPEGVVQAAPSSVGEQHGAALLGALDPIQVEQPCGQRGPERAAR